MFYADVLIIPKSLWPYSYLSSIQKIIFFNTTKDTNSIDATSASSKRATSRYTWWVYYIIICILNYECERDDDIYIIIALVKKRV